MTVVLVIVSLALTTVARLVSDGRDVARSRPPLPAAIGLLLTTILIALFALKYGQEHYRAAIASGLGIGALAIFTAEYLGGSVAPVGVAISATTLLHVLPQPVVAEGQFALMVGLAIGSVILGGRAGFTTAILATAFAAADFLGAGHKNVPAAIDTGSLLGIAALLGMIGVGLLPKKLDGVRSLGIAAVIAAAGFVISQRIVEPHLAMAIGIAAIAGLVVHFLVPDDERDVMRIIIAGIISMSVATIGYSFYKNAGVSAALVTMLAILFGCGNRTGVLATSMVFGLILMRLLHKADVAYSLSLDIGQHMVLLGFFLGALIPLLPLDKLVPSDWRGSLSSALWMVLLITACIFIEVMLGHRGINGFVAGLGIVGIVALLRQERSLMPMAIAPGLVGLSVFFLDQFDHWTDLGKDDKVKFFLIAGAITIALAGGIAVLSRKTTKEVTA